MIQKLWDFRADEFSQHRSSDEGKRKIKRVLEYLLDQNLLDGETEVLDIGCGPGNYALGLARQAKRVTGIDISPNMIQKARGKAAGEGVHNVSFEVTPWETLDLEARGWVKQFDLVFASMCPGINSKDTLLKMVTASRGFCFLSSFARREDEVRDALYKLVHGQEPGSRWGRNIYYIFNLLWLWGYYPSVRYHDSEWVNQTQLEKAVELYSLHLAGSGQLRDDQIKIIRDYLTGIARDGLVREKVRAKVAWLHWAV